jgi:hypothetical protein
MLWPMIVARQTEKYWQRFTGQPMPPERALRLRQELTLVVRDFKITK